MTISLTVSAAIRGLLSTAGDGGTAELQIDERISKLFENGTGAGQGNACYIDEFSIAASGTLNIDLSGSLTDRLGNPVVFTAVKAILLIADATNVNNVIFGNGTNPFVGPFNAGADTVTIEPGGFMLLMTPSAAGWAVGAGSSDVIKLANSSSGTAVTGTIVIIGEA